MKTNPIDSVKKESGTVYITHHTCVNMEEAVVNKLLETYEGGKACVLTGTNEEALCIFGLLLKHGKHAKLIQSLDKFKLSNLIEISTFLDVIDRHRCLSIIPDDIWENAKKEVLSAYGNSACIGNIRRLFSVFETTHEKKYRSDFDEFLNESQYEDFYDTDKRDAIYVSTIHKSKGREFDSVYMMLKNAEGKTDEERRAIYVGMTRAKTSLYIHTNTVLFDEFSIPGVLHFYDKESYSEPSEIILQTTHRDVVLDFFKSRKNIISLLHSGSHLKIDDKYLITERNGRTLQVAKFSASFCEKLLHLKERDYMPIFADVDFVVMWKGKNDEKETPILLNNIHLKKQK